MVLRRALRLLDDQADRVRRPLRRVRHVGRQQEDVALLDRDVARLAVLDDLQDDVALDLVEQFLAGVDVVIGAGVRPADDHDQELAVAPDRLVADRRLEQVAVFVDPAFRLNGANRTLAVLNPVAKPVAAMRFYARSKPGSGTRTTVSGERRGVSPTVWNSTTSGLRLDARRAMNFQHTSGLRLDARRAMNFQHTSGGRRDARQCSNAFARP